MLLPILKLNDLPGLPVSGRLGPDNRDLGYDTLGQWGRETEQNPNKGQYEQSISGTSGSGHWECLMNCDTVRPQTDNDRDIFDNVALCYIWTPLLIDVPGNDFAMTDAANGVMFDFNGDSVPHRISLDCRRVR